MSVSSYDIIPGDTEMIDRIVVALPDEWSVIISGMRKKHDFSGMTAYAFVEELKNEEFHENRRVKHQQRNMGSSASIFGSNKSSSSGTPLKASGFVASSSPQPPSQSQRSTPQPASQGYSFASPSSSSSTSATFEFTQEQVANIGKVSEQKLSKRLGMFANFVNSFHGLLAGDLGPDDVTAEDCLQGDEDDIEKMDLEWQMAMVSYGIQKYQRKTGRTLTFDPKKKMGLDVSKARCFRCNRLGHFIKNCPEPKTSTVRIEEVKTTEPSKAVAQYASSSGPSALQVIHDDEGVPASIDWDAMSSKLTVSAQPTPRDGNLSTFMATIEFDDEETITDNMVEAVADEIVSQQMANEEEEALQRQIQKEIEEVTEKYAAISLEDKPVTAEKAEKAFMAKPESKVCYCNNKPIECSICFTLNDKLIVAKQQEQEARR